jgi:NAD(P)-dependent dehydrogenase (short-subunit alcohol dehydrogenase family)
MTAGEPATDSQSPAAPFPSGAAVVIGGSGGIGRAICQRLAEQGSPVALTYGSNAQAGADAARLVDEAGQGALVAPLTLGDAVAVREFFAQVVGRFARVHTTVFAVGADIPMVYAAEIDEHDWSRTIAGDLTGFFHVAKAAVPLMREHGGSLVALSSAGVLRHPPKDTLSTVPKAGIEALVRAIAREEGRFGVRANAVSLGVVEAGHFHRVKDELTPEFIEAMKRNTALRRLGTAREAADAVVFLASSAASYITGHSLSVDGGYSV